MNSSYCVIDNNGAILQQCRTEQRFPLYSITKPIIAALVLDLGIDILRPLSDWFDEAWVSRGLDISVQQLLTHTSGLRDYFSVPAYHLAVDTGDTPWSDDEFAKHTLRQPLLFKPGGGWAYSNPGFWLLKRICEMESEKDFATLVNQQLNHALNLPSLKVKTGLFSDELPTYQAGWVWHGLVCGNTLDTARFMASDLVSRLATPLVPVPNAGPVYPNAAYGLGVMGNLDGSNYGHNGSGPGFSTSCFHFPGSGLTVSYFMPHSGPDDAAYVQMMELARSHGAV